MTSKPRKNIAWSMASIVTRNGLVMVTFMVLSRLMGPDAFGSISITLMAWGLALTLVDSGFTNVVVRQKELDREVLSTLYWWNVGLGLLAALALSLSGRLVAVFFHDPRLARLLAFASLSLFCIALGQQFLMVLQRQMVFKAIACMEIGAGLVGFGVTLARALQGAGPISYFEGLSAGNAALVIVLFVAARRHFTPLLRFRWADLKPIVGFGCFNTGERCVSFMNTNFEKPLIGRLFTMVDLGLYSAVNQLITRPVSLISGAFSRVAYSLYSTVQDDHAILNDLYIRYSGKLALVTFPMYGFMYLFSDTIIRLFFGEKFLPAAAFLPPLCILGALWSIGNPLGAYLMAINRAQMGFYLNCFSVAVTVTVLWIGSHLSMQAMLYLWVAAVVTVLLPIEWTLRYRLTGMSLGRYLGFVFPPALLVLLLVACFKLGGRMIPCSQGTPVIIGAMAAYLAMYGACGWGIYRRTMKNR